MIDPDLVKIKFLKHEGFSDQETVETTLGKVMSGYGDDCPIGDDEYPHGPIISIEYKGQILLPK